MRLTFFLIFASLSLCLHAAEKPSVTVSTLLKESADLDNLPNPPKGYPGVWSSYDRTGGMMDDQGFIRKEGGKFVIAEMMGPGAITRIWSEQPKGTIEIFVDDGGKPVITISAADLFGGKFKPFVKPWVESSKNGGNYSFIPIPYDRFCKITVTEQFAYEIEYLTYPSETVVEAFKIPWSKTHTTTQTSVAKTIQPSGKPPFTVDQSFVEDAYAFTVPAAETIEFASFAGPAMIKGIQLQWDDRDIRFGRNLALHIRWDHHPEPAVHVPVYDFFGGGTNNWLLGVNENNEGYCYFPMPFHQSARLSVRNDSMKDDIPVHITVFVQSVKTVEELNRYFNAGWDLNTPEQKSFPVSFDMQRKTPVSESTHNLTVFQSGAKGHLAGITVPQAASLNSDVEFTTHSGMRNISLKYSGLRGFMNVTDDQSRTSKTFFGSAKSNTLPFTSSRLFLPTPLPFEEQTRLIFENGHANMAKQSNAVVLYWYQEVQGQLYHALPPAQARHFRQTAIRNPVYRIESDQLVPIPVMEAENAEVAVSGGVFEPQDMSPFGPDWSQNQQIRFEGFQEGAELQITLPDVQYSGWYHLHGVFTQAPDAGIIRIHNPDHVFVEALDLYAEEVSPVEYTSSSPVFLHAGDPVVLSVILTGYNDESTGLHAGIDYLELVADPVIPKSVAVTSPLYQEIKSGDFGLQKITTNQNISIPIGFAESTELKTTKITNSPTQNNFPLGRKTLDIPDDPDSHVLVSLDVDSVQSGIFHFEIQGKSIQNSIFRLSEGRLIRSENQIWVNGIPLHAEEQQYWDAENNDYKPKRYSVPLQKGTNQVSWVMDIDEDVSIQPVFYGLEP